MIIVAKISDALAADGVSSVAFMRKEGKSLRGIYRVYVSRSDGWPPRECLCMNRDEPAFQTNSVGEEWPRQNLPTCEEYL